MNVPYGNGKLNQTPKYSKHKSTGTVFFLFPDVCGFHCDYPFADICISEIARCKGIALCPAGDDQENCGKWHIISFFMLRYNTVFNASTERDVHGEMVYSLNFYQLFATIGDCGVSRIFLHNYIDYNLTSTGYPNYYPHDLNCNWIIDADGLGIIVNIVNFDLERGYDFLTIGTGEVETDHTSRVASLTGVVKLKVLYFDDGILWMRFQTDSTGSSTGFMIQLLQDTLNVPPGKLTIKLYL